VSGNRPPILFIAERDSLLACATEALGRFPRRQRWVLVGGLAVFARLGSVTRPTADADAVARSQAELLRELSRTEITSVISGGSVQVDVGSAQLEIDVIDLADDPLPGDDERRAFALARRAALDSAVDERIVVTALAGDVVADANIPIASVSALVALKTVSMVRRPHGPHPQKVGSDIHDLVRLVTSVGARSVAHDLVALDRDLSEWVAGQVERAFGRDVRYTLVRLRTNDRSAAANALSDDEVGAVEVLGPELRQQLAARYG
jgi:hypothetical protein